MREVHIYPISSYSISIREAKRLTLNENLGFLEGVMEAVAKGRVKLKAGHYLMQEIAIGVVAPETRRGILFSINGQGEVLKGFMGKAKTPNLSVWPPRGTKLDQHDL